MVRYRIQKQGLPVGTAPPCSFPGLLTSCCKFWNHISARPTNSHLWSSLFNDLHFCAHLLDSPQLTLFSSLSSPTAWSVWAASLHRSQSDLRLSTAKHTSITYAAAARNLHARDWVSKPKRNTHSGYTNCSSKTGSRRPSGKTTIFKHFLKGFA